MSFIDSAVANPIRDTAEPVRERRTYGMSPQTSSKCRERSPHRACFAKPARRRRRGGLSLCSRHTTLRTPTNAFANFRLSQRDSSPSSWYSFARS